MDRKCIGVIVFLVLVIFGGIYKFVFQGSTTQSSDGRIAIHLDAAERDLVLTEMRTFLEAVQLITTGIAENNMQQVAQAAKTVGKAAQGEVPGTLIGKLPIEFKKLGFDTHQKFDHLAMNAEEFGDNTTALIELSELMQNCTACHATYRFEITLN